MPSIGPTELIIILAICVLFFGGKKIAELGTGVGKGIRGFKEGLNDLNDASKDLDAAALPKKQPRRKTKAS